MLQLRGAHPAWGGRKLHATLATQWRAQQNRTPLPSASTITAILRRHDRLAPPEQAPSAAWHRFERPAPNERHPTVQTQLTQVFTRYGLPRAILTDNGPPWGAATTPRGLPR